MTTQDNGNWEEVVEELLERIEDLEGQLETYRERHRDAKSNFATMQRLREEVVALRANMSKSVLRRLDVQLGEEHD